MTPTDVHPRRIQITHDKPWQKDHPNAVVVGGPSLWGNPFEVGPDQDHTECVARFRLLCQGRISTKQPFCYPTDQRTFLRQLHTHIDDLHGKDLACWCPLDQPCHGDVLLELANAPRPAIEYPR